MLEEEMSKAVLEFIDLKLSPVLERLEKFERMEFSGKEDFEKSCLATREKDAQVFSADKANLDRKFADVEKKFLVTARLIESVMDAVEKTSPAKKCEADIKGIQLLKGELKT